MVMSRRARPLLAILALVAACNGAGPAADRNRSDEEIAKRAEKLSLEKLESVMKEYDAAIEKETDPAKKEALTRKGLIYIGVATKKQVNEK